MFILAAVAQVRHAYVPALRIQVLYSSVLVLSEMVFARSRGVRQAILAPIFLDASWQCVFQSSLLSNFTPRYFIFLLQGIRVPFMQSGVGGFSRHQLNNIAWHLFGLIDIPLSLHHCTKVAAFCRRFAALSGFGNLVVRATSSAKRYSVTFGVCGMPWMKRLNR